MAQLDANIFLQQQAPDLSQIGSGFERGMRLGDLMKQQKIQDLELQKKNAIADAYKSGVATNPDGTVSQNSEMTLGALMKVDPREAFNFKAQQAANLKSDLESQYAKNSMVSSLLDTVKDQDSYLNAKAYAISKGIKEAEQMPNTYDPQIINSLRAQYQKASLTPLQQIEDSRKREEAQARIAELKDNRNLQLGNLNQKKYEFEKEMELKRLAESAKYGPKPVEKRLADLNSGDKARLDNIKLGYPAASAMDKALNDGDNTFSLFGDNKFTVALDQMAEAFGRMQSGGAINKDEEARFKKMSPTSTDSKEIQAQKLANMQKVFLDRLDTLGFKPEEVGIQKQELSYGKKSEAIPKEGDTKEYQGVTYRVVNGHWVQQ